MCDLQSVDNQGLQALLAQAMTIVGRRHARALALTLAVPALILAGAGATASSAAAVRGAGTTARALTSAPALLVGRPAILHGHKHHHKLVRPSIKAQPAAAYAAPGSYVHFTAAASGYPHPSAQWQVSDNGGKSWRNLSGVHSYTFTFMAVGGQNGDEFRVVFKNKRGKATSAAARLSVNASYASPLIASQPSDLTVVAGAAATFTAAANGDPPPTVQWQVSGNGGVTWTDLSGATSPTLTFVASSVLNGYEFRAQYANVLGTALSRSATLTVSGVAGETPVLTEQPVGADVEPGATVTYIAAASGTPAPSVQWQVSTDAGQTWTPIPGATASTYSFTASSDENLNEYEAVFTNANGMATSEPAALGVGYQLTSNWAGYAAVGNTFSSVSASWTVPAVTCPAGSDASSSQWVGIDGASDETVEQDGTWADCVGAMPSYGAWYELAGDDVPLENDGSQINITGHPNAASYPVSAGDSMTASVSVNSGGQWTFTVSDSTARPSWTFSTTVAWSAPAQSSAEWIAERPENCPTANNCSFTTLANFGDVTFSNATATIAGSSSESAQALGAIPLQMIRSASNTTLLASPSNPLSLSGEGFTDTWYAGS